MKSKNLLMAIIGVLLVAALMAGCAAPAAPAADSGSDEASSEEAATEEPSEEAAADEGAAADLTKAKEACWRSNQETAGRLFDWPGQKDRILGSKGYQPDLSEERSACAVRCS